MCQVVAASRMRAHDDVPDVSGDLVGQLPLFQGLPDQDLRALAAAGRARRCRSGDEIAGPDDADTTAVVVIGGEVGLHHIDEAGRILVVDVVGQGDAIWLPGSELADSIEDTLCAMTDDAVVLLVPRELLRAVLGKRIDVRDPLVVSLFRRLRRSYARQPQFAFESVKKRLARELVRLARRDPDHRVYESDEQLGALVGARRPTINNALKALRRVHLIQYRHNRKWITVPDPDKLERELQSFR